MWCALSAGITPRCSAGICGSADLDVATYRSRWKLSADHPITAPAYSERRSTMAKHLGVGRRPGAVVSTTEVMAQPQPGGAVNPTVNSRGTAPARGRLYRILCTGSRAGARGGGGMAAGIEIREAKRGDAPAIAEIHLTARLDAMPYLHRPHTDDDVRAYFVRAVGDRPSAWWVARVEDQVVGFMLIDGQDIDHLYVRPGWQRRGIGLSPLNKAKTLSPQRLELWAFQRNTNARAFYETQGFRAVAYTDGSNEENEPDVKYAWGPAR
jgi:GNAT superfamily N-acetyltransferase